MLDRDKNHNRSKIIDTGPSRQNGKAPILSSCALFSGDLRHLQHNLIRTPCNQMSVIG